MSLGRSTSCLLFGWVALLGEGISRELELAGSLGGRWSGHAEALWVQHVPGHRWETVSDVIDVINAPQLCCSGLCVCPDFWRVAVNHARHCVPSHITAVTNGVGDLTV